MSTGRSPSGDLGVLSAAVLALAAGCAPPDPAPPGEGTGGVERGDPPSDTPPDTPAEPRHLDGLTLAWEVTFPGGQVHWVEFRHATDRSTLRIDQSLEPGSSRVQEFRERDEAWRMVKGSSASVALDGDDLDVTLRRHHLRAALFSWPDHYDWSAPGPQRLAAIPRADRPDERRGTLLAECDDEGRPERVTAHDAAGEPTDRIEVLAWGELAGRPRPLRTRLFVVEGAAASEVWSERLLRAQTGVLTEDFARPSDRRDRAGSTRSLPIEAVVLPAGVERAVAWSEVDPSGAAEWATRVAAAERFVFAYEVDHGRSLQRPPTFELDDAGAPLRLVLRLGRGADEAAPPEWSTVEARSGYSVFVRSPDGIAARAADLRARAGSRARGSVRVRVLAGEPGERRAQLTLALDP